MLKIVLAILGTASVLSAPIASAASYPERPITLVAPFAAGGTSDLLARAAAERMSELLGQRVIVENKVGAGGTVGLASVAKAQPDGYTIGLGGVGSLVHSAGTYAGKLAFDVNKDFAPVALLGTTPVAIAVSKSLNVSSLQDLFSLARKDPSLTYGSAGVGSATHLGAELFQKIAGIKIAHAPYRGLAPAMTDLLGEQIKIVFGDVSTVMPHHGGDRVKVIAVLADERVPQLPDVPTAKEQGFFNLVVQVWYGLVAPAGIPNEALDQLRKSAQTVANSEQFVAAIQKAGFTKLSGDHEAFSHLINQELSLWLPIIKEGKIAGQ
jgi:tripartite-type tricarboxylate transporter receptor subunit TctC